MTRPFELKLWMADDSKATITRKSPSVVFRVEYSTRNTVTSIVAADVAPPGLIMAIATGKETVQPIRNVLMAACAQCRRPDPDPDPDSPPVEAKK